MELYLHLACKNKTIITGWIHLSLTNQEINPSLFASLGLPTVVKLVDKDTLLKEREEKKKVIILSILYF